MQQFGSGESAARGGAPTALVGSSTAMRRLREQARSAARFDEPVLVLGETGSGKELLARYLHGHSHRRHLPLQLIHCAGLAAEVLAAELFGHTTGSFTGATKDRAGRIRAAEGSTVVLDEISETPAAFQAAVLRAVEAGELQPVGQDRTVRIDVRFVATSNRPARELRAGRGFRIDLYHRLAAFVLEVPPLREHPEDIPELVEHFLAELRERYGAPCGISTAALRLLQGLRFPGNVRELRQILMRGYAAAGGGEIGLETIASLIEDDGGAGLGTEDGGRSAVPLSLERLVRRHIRRTLELTDGNLSQAARLLEVPRSTLQHYLVKYRVETPQRRAEAGREAAR